MEEVVTIIPHTGGKNFRNKLQYLFVNPEFKKEVNKIREKFKLPAYGIKSFLGVDNKASGEERLANRRKFMNLMALLFTNKDLKAQKLRIKSRKIEYHGEITKLRLRFDLPIRFQDHLAHMFIPYNKLPDSYPHSAACLIRVFDARREKRLFLEIFSDTKKQDLIDSWQCVCRARKDHNIKKGFFLGDYENYYLGRLVTDLRSQGIKDSQIYYKIKELTGIDNKKLLDGRYVKSLRQKHRKLDCQGR